MSKTITGEVRFSFVNVFEPRAQVEGGEPRYSITLLIPKSDVKTLNEIHKAIESAKQEGISKVFNGTLPPMVRVPLHDGDGVRPNGEPFGEECRGHMVMTASSTQKPDVVGDDLKPVMNRSDVYSGCYGRVSLNFFAYNKNGNRGIGCGLRNVQKLRDGEPLSGKTSASEDFGLPFSPAPVQQQAVQPQNQYGYTQQATQPQNQYSYTQQAVQPQNQYGYTQPQIDPITGKPMTGGVMGVDNVPFH